ncbi:kielin/chordin-like protein [Cotesia glomerata]|uniref:kielin/chordin-like protein n=1 Tax=Cotesia glomerata TaxID=32391 RepID=UPI001D02D745|nr:kielin/chordin-like protein [Cotesia glomerata]
MGSTRIAFTCCYLLFVAAISAETCDKSKCPGPLAYYQVLNCAPVYRLPEDCCPYKFNCDHLYSRSREKCYVNKGQEYEIGEKLREEDSNPCDIGCVCRSGIDNIAVFNCAIVDCFHGPVKPGCYLRNSPSQCCPGEEVCPENPEDRAICEVNGKEYRDGEYFEDLSEPDNSCICQPGYAGKNEPPFCIKPSRPYCSPEMRHASDIYNRCAPVYYSSQSPQTSCSVFSRCQNSKDEIIKNETSTSDPDMTCIFGNFTMNAGDELNQATDYNSVCVKCVCEVGPVPTCQRLPDEQCDITKHPPFEV